VAGEAVILLRKYKSLLSPSRRRRLVIFLDLRYEIYDFRLIGDCLIAELRFAAESKHFELGSTPQNHISEIVYLTS
jgi:hypothetical protein